MSYKGKTPHQYDRTSRSFNLGAWKNWPPSVRDGRDMFYHARLDREMLARRERKQRFTDAAPRFRFNGKQDTKFFGKGER